MMPKASALVAALLGGAAADLCAQGADCGGQVWNDCGTACPNICGIDQSDLLSCTMQCVAEFQCPDGACFQNDRVVGGNNVPGACEGAVVAGPCAQAVAGMPGGVVGAFIPQCAADGEYEPLQRHGSTGYSWCVDNQGAELTTPVGPGDPAGETAESCAAIQLQAGAPAPVPAPMRLSDGEQPADDADVQTEDEKLGLVFALSLLTLVLLPVAVYCLLKKACEKDEPGNSRASLVGEDSSNRESKDDGGGGEEEGGKGEGEMSPLQRSSGP